jgi:hypothetical protein
MALTMAVTAQTQVKITNVKILDGDREVIGNDQTASLKGAEGSERFVLHNDPTYMVKTWFKVSTHNVARSSVKDGAVNLIMQLDLFVGDKRQDQKRVERIFYAGDKRTTSYLERFTMKTGINVRTITVSFDAELL